MTGSGISMRSEGLRGHGLYRQMVDGLLLEDSDYLFSGRLSGKDAKALHRMAGSVERLTSDISLDPPLGGMVARGQWGKLTERLGGPAAAADALMLLYLPACHVDAFSVCVLTDEGQRPPLKTASESDVPTWINRVTSETATLEQLHRFVAWGALKWLGDMRYFDFGLTNEATRARAERFARALRLIADHPKAYSASMKAARAREWSAADAVAADLLAKGGIEGGDTIDWPPALADILLTTFIPACYGPPLEKSVRVAAKAA